jgi:predicted Zn-dependent peptidase
MKTHFHTLKNGLELILVDTEAFPSLTSLLLVGAGSRYEDTKNNGIAHFFEHMAFKGSKKYPNAFVLSSIIEGLGGEFNAFTSKDYTGYYVKAPAKHADEVSDVLADMIQKPLLNKAEIDREKGVIVQEIAMNEDTPQRWVFRLYENLLYKNTPLGMNVIGTKENVLGFNKGTFTSYIDKLYHPNNSIYVLAGGLTSNGKLIEDYIKIVESKFKNWKKSEVGNFERIQDKQNKPEVLLRYKKSEQAHLCIGYRTFGDEDQKKYALSVLTAILGNGMSSRLFMEVREKRGLCYSIGSYTDHYHEVGNFLTYAGISTDESRVIETISVIVDEYNKVSDKGVSEEELLRAKELLKGRLILSLEDSFNIAYVYGKELLTTGKLTPVKTLLEKIDEVTAEDVRSLANEYFTPDKLNLALIGPFKNEKKFISAIS